MGQHIFGVKRGGRRYRLNGTFDDKTFQELAAKELPQDWFAWHLEDTENIDNSPRARALLNVPELSGGLSLWVTTIPYGLTMAEPYMRYFAKTGIDLLLRPQENQRRG